MPWPSDPLGNLKDIWIIPDTSHREVWPCGRPRTHWRDYISQVAAITLHLFLSGSFTHFISILCEHGAVLVSHPVSWVPRQMLPLHYTRIPNPPSDQCLLFLPLVYGVPLRLGKADVRLCPWASVFKSSKCFHVNSGVPQLPTEPISQTVVKEGLHCQGPGGQS